MIDACWKPVSMLQMPSSCGWSYILRMIRH